MIVERFGVMSCGTLMGCLYASLGVFAGLAIFAAGIVMAFIGESEAGGMMLGGVMFGFLGTILYGVMGFVVGLIMAALYNLVAMLVGGIEIEFEEDTPAGPQIVAPHPEPQG